MSFVEINPFKFTSQVYSLDRLMADGLETDVGLVIPNYQRNYTWEREQVQRLYTDILLSFSNRLKKPSGYFLGATVWSLRKRPQELEFPISSYDVVDGQQRITTCILLTYNLLIAIRRNLTGLDISSSIRSKLKTWIESEVGQVEDRAREMLVGEFRRSDSKYYPRLISEMDTRGKSHLTSDYKSPISQVILNWIESIDSDTHEQDLTGINVGPSDQNSLDRILDNHLCLSECVSDIGSAAFHERWNIPYVQRTELKTRLFLELFSSRPPTSEFQTALDSNSRFETQIRLIQFFWHFLKSSCFTVITCEDEDAAFSIFDSLNTTGVPLTAIETLKPYVMRHYSDENRTFLGSTSDENFRYLKQSIQAPGNDAKKQSDISKELAIHATLLGCERGRINNNLTTQRRALNEMQQKCKQNGEIDLASTTLKKIAEYREQFCFIENIRSFPQPILLSAEQDDTVKLTSAFLANTNTRLYRPILTRFIWHPEGVELFHDACKAITAFYVLRRATSYSTDRIDEIFRDCMSDNGAFSGLELKHASPKKLEKSDLENFKNYLKSNLSSSNLEFTIEDKDSWVQHVQSMTHYNGAKTLLRFMLLVAHDGAKIDSADNTLIQRQDASPDSSTQFLTFPTWDKDLYETLEHVAPQNEQSEGWPGVYDNPKLKDTIGNFVLLPKGLNSALSNSGWPVKKLFLKVLLSDANSERKQILLEASAHGIKLPPSIERSVLSRSGSLVKSHMLSGLENVDNWDADYICKRGERLCELVWDKMIEWFD